MKKAIIVTAMLSALAAPSIAKETPKVSVATQEVVPGIHMLYGEGGFIGGNMGLLVGDEAVVLIDDGMPNALDLINKSIAGISDKPIDYLVNTHVHGDHAGNNAAMSEAGAHIVAHENLRQHMLDKGVQGPEGMVPAPKAALPVLTFSDRMTFHFNGQPATVFHLPQAHTDGDALIHFTEANVIHMGDTFFNGLFPFIDLDSGGTLEGYIHAQMKVISMSNDETKIIPGHGPLASKADLQKALDMLIDCKKIIMAEIKKGHDIEQIVKDNPLHKYHDDWNWGFITTERMTRQLYNDLSQHATSGSGHSHGGGQGHSH